MVSYPRIMRSRIRLDEMVGTKLFIYISILYVIRGCCIVLACSQEQL